MKQTKHSLTLETIRKLIRKEARQNLRNLLERIHPVDLASILEDLSLDELTIVFDEIGDDERGSTVLASLDTELTQKVIEHIDKAKIVKLMKKMPPDDAASIIESLPEQKSNEVKTELLSLKEMDQIEDLLMYPEQTAGRIMTQQVFALSGDLAVADAIEQIRKAERAEMVFYVYVIDEQKKLLGVVSLRKLLLVNPCLTLKEIMLSDVISVQPHMDQEEVAHLVARYDLLAIPVVDEFGKLLGIITVDDIIDIIHEEAKEDIYQLAGSNMIEQDAQSVFRMAKIRLPWLLVRFLGGIIAMLLIYNFHVHFAKLPEFVIWGAFLPLIISMIGGIGIQSSTIIAEGLVLRSDSTQFKIGSLLAKELIIGLFIGLCYSVLSLVFIFTDVPLSTILIVSVSLFCGMIGASLIGALLPIIYYWLNRDPVKATGSIISSVLDLISVGVYILTAITIHRVLKIPY